VYNYSYIQKGPVETPITDQEIAFALLLLRGTLTDRGAAEAVGISPGQAAYVKAKPRVKAYIDEHRASVRVGLVPVFSELFLESHSVVAESKCSSGSTERFGKNQTNQF
jgi:hypothetical protein